MPKKLNPKELGFGNMASPNGQRFMNADGTANVRRVGGPVVSISDIFHKLLAMKWSKFFLMILIAYTIANFLFATAYYLCGVQDLGIKPSGNVVRDFMECFFFSTQCFTTIGFGRVNPQGLATNLVASTEGLVGLLSFAIATGLLYGRFSRPRAQLVHSENLLISPYKNTKRGAMFRIASTRKHSLLVDNTISVSFGINVEEVDGPPRRQFYILDLELDRINFLSLSWTVVHPITPESPLFGKSYEDLQKGRAEFLILFRAMEETNSQIVLERFSYFVDEVVWGAKFVPVIGTSDDGQPVLDMDRLGIWEHAELPEEKATPEPASATG